MHIFGNMSGFWVLLTSFVCHCLQLIAGPVSAPDVSCGLCHHCADSVPAYPCSRPAKKCIRCDGKNGIGSKGKKNEEEGMDAPERKERNDGDDDAVGRMRRMLLLCVFYYYFAGYFPWKNWQK